MNLNDHPTLDGAHVALLCINYAPEVTGIAPYATAVSRHLASRGASVTVLTGIPHYPSWVPSPEFRRRRSVQHDAGVRVVRLRHYVPSRQSSLRRGLYEGTWLANAFADGVSTHADAVIAMTPPLASLPLARAMSRRGRVPWAPVVMDLMGSAALNSGVAGGGGVAGAVSALEGSSLLAADLVGVIGAGFAHAVTSIGVAPAKVRMLENWTHVRPSSRTRREARQALGWPDDRPIAVHTGNMGLKQDLENIVEAARLAERQGTPMRFVLVGDGNQRAHLERSAQGLTTLRFEAPVDEAAYPDVLAAADVLLVNEAPGMVEMSLPSKLTSYLAARRPVVAAVPQDGWTAAVLDASGGALRVQPGEPQQVLDAVLSVVTNTRDSQTLADAGADYAASHLSEAAGLARYEALVSELLSLKEVT